MNRRAIIEPLLSTAGLVIITSILVRIPALVPWQSIGFVVCAIYGPILLCWARRRPWPYFERSWRAIGRGLAWAIGAAVVIFPPYLLVAHGWQTLVGGLAFHGVASLPTLDLVGTQLLLVALPEEFFFRGYVQPACDAAWGTRWRLLGADLGWGWVVTSAIFAAAHSAIAVQWWHFAIFFPGLLFGFLRARTGGLIAPIGIHALSNLVMDWLARSYG